MIDCVTLSTNHHFGYNPIYRQHQLRYQSIIERQGWEVPTIEDMEYDSYDNPAAYYLVKKDHAGKAIGVSRLYPTDRPYMLQQSFSHLVSKIDLPSTPRVWEGSRFCVERSIEPDMRKRIIQEIVIGYLEFSLVKKIRSIIGVMYPVYWRNIFVKSGWDVEWLGEIHRSEEGHKIIAGNLVVTQEVLNRVRSITGIHDPVLNFGHDEEESLAA
ncbi:MAG: GNAT family N-acetyltransferase [Alphaproteobacteria bacterium]|nr:GNAT family N-acetyltransferase [Alphaproteobacteria bacterium]MCB9975676.1 GNAT family N-acetyltransferase [Rhodospirillales bacterium]